MRPAGAEDEQAELVAAQRQLFDGLPQLAWTCTPEGADSDFNQRWLDYTGLTASESLGVGWLALVASEERASVEASWEQARQAGTPYARELRLRGRDGSHRWFDTQVTPLVGSAGRIDRWVGTCTDVTARRAAEEALQQQQRELRALFDLIPAMIWFKDTHNRHLRVNQRVADATGRTVEEIEGRPCADIYPAEADKYYADDLEVIRSGQPRLGIIEQLRGPDGGERWVKTDKVPFRDATGEVVGILVVAEDISERKRSEDARREEQERMARLAEMAPGVMHSFRLRPDGQMVFPYVNLRIQDIYGLAPESLAIDASSIATRLSPDDVARVRASIEESQRALTPWRQEFRVRHPRKGEIWVEGHSMPVRDEDGGTTWHGVLTDITERKRIEEQLNYEQELRRQTGVLAKVGGWEFDPFTGRGSWTEEVARIHDLVETTSTMDLGLGFYEGEHRARLEAALQQAMNDGTPYDLEVEMTSARGVKKWVRTICQPVVEEGRVVRMRGAFQDITERVKSDEARRDSEAMLQAVTATIIEGLFVTDLEGNVLLSNRAANEMHEVDEEPVDNQASDLGFEIFTLEGEKAPYEQWPIARLLAGERLVGHEALVRRSGSSWERVFSYSGGLARDSRGRSLAIMSFIDVTERRRESARREALEAQLRQAHRLDAIGKLSGGIAHDFNNILSVIVANVDLAIEDIEPSHPASERLRAVSQASERARSLVQRILLFARQRTQERLVLSPGCVVEESVQMLHAILPAGVELVLHREADVPDVLADPTQIHQVVMNLGTNAWHALEQDTGRIEVRLDSVVIDAAEAGRHVGASPGRHMRLSVTDTGNGMEADCLEHIFDPFFTTKAPGRGTGLGLSVVHGIVQSHGGFIEAESTLGQGARFAVYLPEATTPPPAPVAPQATTRQGRGERVLYLDDEPMIVAVATRALERLGFRVTAFSEALEALATFRATPWEFDVVVTDLNMPELSGIDVATEMLRLRPELPILIVSGHLSDDVLERVRGLGIREVVQKPVRTRELGEALLDALDTPGEARARREGERGGREVLVLPAWCSGSRRSRTSIWRRGSSGSTRS